MTERVVITGVGSICSVAPDHAALPAAIERRACGIATVFATQRVRSGLGARVPDAWLADLAGSEDLDLETDRCLLLSLAAARQAVTSAAFDERLFVAIGLAGGEMARTRLAYESVACGTPVTPSQILRTAGSVASAIVHRLGVPTCALEVHQNACAAGLTAMGSAADALRNGEAEIALAGGSEALDLGIHLGFDGIRALSADTLRPFDEARSGTVLGEAAAFVVLETEKHAVARKVKILAEFCGYGMSNDAFHRTRPDPTGAGQAGAMTAALRDARVGAGDIDLIYAHGTGTPANDEVELRAIETALGTYARQAPVISVKGAVGHTIAASGALNVAYAIIAIDRSVAAGNVGLRSVIPEYAGWKIPDSPVPVHPTTVLVNAFAFGGNNCSAVIRRAARS